MSDRTKVIPARPAPVPAGGAATRPASGAAAAVTVPRPRLTDCRLILGGHTFIAPLGRDAEPSAEEARAIVAGCVTGGASLVDTTYAPERSAFARAIAACGTDAAGATPIVWNFFGPLADPLPPPAAWTEARWAEAVAELAPWAGRPVLVLHPVDDPADDRRQVATVVRWKRQGRIAALGLWAACGDAWAAGQQAALDFVVAPWNVATAAGTRPLFAAARDRGLLTVGTSPFTRGWELDRLAKRLAALEQRPIADARARVADALLRFAAFAPEVDHLIVAMRAASHVTDNFASLARGPLTPRELRWIEGLARWRP